MKKNIIIIAILILGIFSVATLSIFNKYSQKSEDIIVDETEDVSDLIKVTEPTAGTAITSPLRISGEARGYWFFEATFPVALLDANGKIIVQHYAQAKGEWMTEDFVPFETVLTFAPQTSGAKGFLVLQKDNPSGLPEYDKEIRIPIVFK